MYDASIMTLGLVRSRRIACKWARSGAAAIVIAAVGACSSSPKPSQSSQTGQRGTYKVGNTYKIDGVSYTPQETFTLVETGVASWYGPGFHGKSTANGERYNQSDRTAAHRTLQMPAIVRVTNLDNGLTTVVRVNDRGPFARNRVIDLSRTAAEEIDMIGRGTARVRIEQLQAESLAVKEVALGGGGPEEQQAAVARVSSGQRISPAAPPTQVIAVAQPTYAPPPQPAQAAPPPAPSATVISSSATIPPSPPIGSPTVASLSAAAASGYFVQVGAFSTPENAERQRVAVRSYGNPETFRALAGGREVYRVRMGPYTTSDAAGIVADRLRRSGYGDARVVAD